MAKGIKDSFSTEKGMARARKSGKILLYTKATGITVWLTERDDSSRQMAMYTKDSGKMISSQAMALITTLMDRLMWASGKTIHKMDMAYTNIRMGQSITDITKMESRMDRANSGGLMDHGLKVPSMRIRSKARENLFGPISNLMKDIGIITKCMEGESSSGLTTKSMKDSMLTMSNRVMVKCLGQMAGPTKANGETACRMEMECIETSQGYGDKEFG